MKVFALIVCALVLTGTLLAEAGDSWTATSGRNPGGNLDQQWGPDAFGYRAKNQQEAGGPTPAWFDISSNGMRVTGTGDDNIIGPFDIGFNFHYYWYDVNRFWVGSNGYIKFSSRGQLASPIGQFPNTALPNDVVGPYVVDWVMAANNPTDSVCYYRSNYNDTLIVMWKNIAAYSGGGSHSFELILSAVDSSITFQYGTQTGTITSGDAVGIENFTGHVGLTTLFGSNYPAANTAIKFYYPDTLSYVTHDMAVIAVQNPLSAGYHVLTSTQVTPWLQVANMGTEVESSCSLHYSIRRPDNTVLFQLDTLLGVLTSLDTLTIASGQSWAAADTGTYLAVATVDLAGDSVAANNTIRTEFHVVNMPGELAYDDGQSDRLTGWNSAGRAAAMEFIPPLYPVAVSQIRAYLSGSTAYEISILRNDMPDGSPGSEIWRHHFTSATTGWNTINVGGDSARFDFGSFTVALWTPSGLQFGLDTTSAQGISHRVWEYVNAWGQNKWWNTGDVMVRASLRSIFPPPGPFSRVQPSDNSTVRWMHGLVQFRWTASHDSGTTVTYHLAVNSGDYHRTFATTDTTFGDSLAWFYGGGHFASVTWSVWATNGSDSIQASNGTGMFQLLANEPPSAFVRVAPADTFLGTNPYVTCRWTGSHDPDNDPVRYLFHAEHRPGYWPIHPADTVTSDTSLNLSVDIPTDPSLTIQHFYWTVKATDNYDTVNASNGEGHFWIDILDVPNAPGGLVIKEYALRSYPNPFNSTATLSYDLPAASNVELKVYNLVGEIIAEMHPGFQSPGRYRLHWDASEHPSGTYFCILKAGNTTKIQKLLLLK